MLKRRAIFVHDRLWVMALLLSGMASGLFGEKIRFSKPVVPLVAPPKIQEDLPDLQGRKLEFATPSMDQPIMPAPVVRVAPRQKEKEEDRTHWLMRDPKQFPDALGRASQENSLSGWGRDSLNADKRSNATSLATILNPDNAGKLRQGGKERENDWFEDLKGRRDRLAAGNRPGNSDRNDRADRKNIFGRESLKPNSSEEDTEVRSPFFGDAFAPRQKEKPTPSQLERREEFERLLNPIPSGPSGPSGPIGITGATGGRVPGSLQPVLDPFGPPPAPRPSAPAEKLESHPVDSLTAFKQHQLRLRGPVLEDNTKKYETQPSTPAGTLSDASARPSLMRQPTTHDIPARKF